MRHTHLFAIAALAVVFLTGFSRVSAQDTTANARISFLLAKAKFESNISPKYAEKVERQLASVLTSGVNTYGAPFSVFSIQPTVSVLESAQIEGMQDRKAVKLNVNLRVVNAVSGETFASSDVVVTGSGTSEDEAVSRALNNIRQNNPALRRELGNLDAKVRAHYQAHCADVLTAAAAHEQRKEYNAALALLHSVPQGTPCFNEVAARKTAVFAQVQATNCQNLLTRADAHIAGNNFLGALLLLSQVDATAPCAAEVKARIATVETKVDAAQKENWEWLFKFWATGAEAEKARYNALTACALTWLRGSGKCDLR